MKCEHIEKVMISQYHRHAFAHEASWKAKGEFNETLKFSFFLLLHIGKKIRQDTSKCLEFRTYK